MAFFLLEFCFLYLICFFMCVCVLLACLVLRTRASQVCGCVCFVLRIKSIKGRQTLSCDGPPARVS